MADVPGFPPVTYSYLFVPCVIKAAKKANSQAAELANILNSKDRDCETGRKLSRKKVQQLAKTAFGSLQAKLPDDSRVANTPSEETVPYVQRNGPDDLTLLQLLALNALDLTAPASHILLQNRPSKFIQLSGHEGGFAPAGPGTIWKKCNSDGIEMQAYEKLTCDTLASVVPRYYKTVEYNGERFIEMQDLLHNFKNPSIMDIKIGTRTYLEAEVQNTKPRPDLYEKMVAVDPDATTAEENAAQAVTKLRYMQFRDNYSSSSELGFRIEGFKLNGQEPTKKVKNMKSKEDVIQTLKQFLDSSEKMRLQLISRLQHLRAKLEKSPFFQKHEVIGSSILLIHDDKHSGAWMIDFGKTKPVPQGVSINHRSPWHPGNCEDGYLTGLDNLIMILKECGKSKSKNAGL